MNNNNTINKKADCQQVCISMPEEDLARLVSNRFQDEIVPADLSSAEIRFLLYVFNRTASLAIPNKRIPAKEAANAIGVDRTRASKIISQLLRKGFIYRVGGSFGEIGITCLRSFFQDASTLAASETSHLHGFIYMLANSAMPGIFKVGMTRRSPQERAEELSKSTSSPAPFKVVSSIEVDDPIKVERLVHDYLSAYRVSGNREFFRVTQNQFNEAVHAATPGGAA